MNEGVSNLKKHVYNQTRKRVV